MLRSQAHYNALRLSQRARELLIENEAFASIMNVGYATPEALSDVDRARCSIYMFLQFNQWAYLFYQHDDGSIPAEYWVGAEDYCKAWWRQNRATPASGLRTDRRPTNRSRVCRARVRRQADAGAV